MRVSPTVMIIGSGAFALMNSWNAGNILDFMLAQSDFPYYSVWPILFMLNIWIAYDLIRGMKPLAERYALERVKKERDRGDRDL